MNRDGFSQFFGHVDTTALCDADKTIRVMASAIRCRSAQPRLIGPAFTVRCRDDFLPVLRAVEAAEPGDVVVVDGGAREVAVAGELFARGALARHLAGIVIDAGFRDMAYVSSCPLPVYSRFVTPMSGTTDQLGELQVSVSCGGVTVNPGDVVIADQEGIIIVSPSEVDSLFESAQVIKEMERRLIACLDSGSVLSDGFNLSQHVTALTAGRSSALAFRV